MLNYKFAVFCHNSRLSNLAKQFWPHVWPYLLTTWDWKPNVYRAFRLFLPKLPRNFLIKTVRLRLDKISPEHFSLSIAEYFLKGEFLCGFYLRQFYLQAFTNNDNSSIMSVYNLLCSQKCNCNKHFSEMWFFFRISVGHTVFAENWKAVCEDCTGYLHHKRKVFGTQKIQLASLDLSLLACTDPSDLSDGQDLPDFIKRSGRCVRYHRADGMVWPDQWDLAGVPDRSALLHSE